MTYCGRLKSTIYAGMALAAKTRLRKKILEEGWSRGITPEWIEITSSLKKRWCNGVARYTILRWAVNQDDDVWLANRGTRHSQQCSQCSSKGDSFPGGHTVSPLCWYKVILRMHVLPVDVATTLLVIGRDGALSLSRLLGSYCAHLPSSSAYLI